MLHGHGALILQCVSKTQPMTATQIHAAAIQKTVCRPPSRSTLFAHLGTLVAMGCLRKKGRTYLRLVDSEFDLPFESEVAA